MRDDWNDELRRAYDRGYWDARREFEHHLRLDHNRDQGRGERRGDWEREFNAPERYGRPADSMSEYWSGDDRGSYGWNADQGYQGGHREGPGPYGSQGSRFGYRGEPDRGGYNDYPPGDRRAAMESHDDRGFLERAGDTISSWFGGDDDRRSERYSSEPGRMERRGRDDREGIDRARNNHGDIWW
jgi:hypothetical protein